MFYSATIGLLILAVVVAYFLNNPLGHGRWFITRRFINWFPLGMTYAFLYMGRYNLTVAVKALGTVISNREFGIIFGLGTVTYAVSFVVNGPLVDKIGGKKGILIAAVGAALANVGLGTLTWHLAAGGSRAHVVPAFSVLYALNMYFQSYGAVSIIKVKAYWFHVRERGVFGAIFGALISIGVYLAFDWGQAIINLTKAGAVEAGWLRDLLRGTFAGPGAGDATWAVFFVPAAILVGWAVLDVFLIKDTPEDAGFAAFDTHDASSGAMDVEYTARDLLLKVFTSPLLILVALVELTSGVFRNGVAQWYTLFEAKVGQPSAVFFVHNWGWLLCVFGIVGGFAAGMVSDKVYQSRRGPPAAILSAAVLCFALAMGASLYASPWVAGAAAVMIWTCGVGITSLMSGTAAADFGGRKATATCSGIVDGFAYLGSGLQSFCIGYLSEHSWRWWPFFLAPFAVFGLVMALKIWGSLPPATKKYIAEVERMDRPPTSVSAGA